MKFNALVIAIKTCIPKVSSLNTLLYWAYHELFLYETSCRRPLVAKRPQGRGERTGLFSRVSFFKLVLSMREWPPTASNFGIRLRFNSSKVKRDWKDCLWISTIGLPDRYSRRSCCSCESASFGTWGNKLSERSRVSNDRSPLNANWLTLNICWLRCRNN